MSGIDPLLTPDEAASILKVSRDEFQRLAETGAFPVLRISPRVIRYKRDDIDTYRTSVAPLTPHGNKPSEVDDLIGTVYFVQCNEFVKIGFTAKSMQYRMRHLQTGNPVKLKKLYAIENVEHRFEKKLHEMFGGARQRDEWFYLNKELLHPSGNKAITIAKFCQALASDEDATLAEYGLNWRRGA